MVSIRLVVGLFALWTFFIGVRPAAALCTGTGDDTAALNTMVQAGGIVTLPAGKCLVSSLNATNLAGAVIQGQGPGRTYLLPLPGTTAAVVDLTGSSFVTLRDLQIGIGPGEPAAPQYPTVTSAGLLTAQRAGNASCNRLVIDNVQVTGSYTGWAWYNLGCASSEVRSSAFWNFSEVGAGTVTFTSKNIWGMGSLYQAIQAGLEYAADWAFFGTEMHADRLAGGAIAYPTFVCHACSAVKFYGRTIAGSGPAYVWTQTSDGMAVGPLYFYGVTFYSDNGTPAAATFGGTPTTIYSYP